MDKQKPSLTQQILSEPTDFSLVLGGFLYQFFRRTHLIGNAGQLLRRRVLFIALLTWLPLLLLSVASGQALGDAVMLPFLIDIEMQVRLLFALPLLVIAELVVHQRMRPLVGMFLERGLIPEGARPHFKRAIESAMRLRNSAVIEILLIAIVYGVGVLFIWRTRISLDVTSWYGFDIHGKFEPSLAGWWLGLVSLPIFQFLLIRWYFRLFIWARFLWQISRIKLCLIPTHPDRACGLGFLTQVCYAFTPLLLAQGALLSGMLFERIYFNGANLSEFKLEIVGMVALMLFSILGPLLVFTPQLAAAKRDGLRDYGTLAQNYTREFDRKWLQNHRSSQEPLMGSADIQSLADLNSSFDVIQNMRVFPFNLQNVIQLTALTLLPVVPLLLTLFSIEDLLVKLLQILL